MWNVRIYARDVDDPVASCCMYMYESQGGILKSCVGQQALCLYISESKAIETTFNECNKRIEECT